VAKSNDANRYRLEAEYARNKMRLAIGEERTAWRQIAEAYEKLQELARVGAKA
jgi:hypothetical protein